jgi:hypothetical protein
VDVEVASYVALSVPALIAGIGIGLAPFGRVSDVGFRRAVLVLLLLAGAGAAADHEGVAAVIGAKPTVALTASR